MEDEHGFAPQRLCDYEVALRDVLHFRKNLKREEWRAIGALISERKRQAKESEVIWNNAPFDSKKLRKELLRNSRPKSGRSRNVNLELPHGLVIRTPPRSPAPCAAVLLPALDPQLANAPAISPQPVSGGNNLSVQSSSAADETIWEVQQAPLEAGEFGVSPYRKLRRNLPFNRCMSQIMDLAQSHQLQFCTPTVETWTPVSPRLFGANPSWELFAGQIYKLSNLDHTYTDFPENVWFLKWVGISADFTFLRLLFSIDSPTAGAVYEALLGIADQLLMEKLAEVLFALRPVLRPNNPTSINDAEFFRVFVRIGTESGGGLEILNTYLGNEPLLSIAKRDEFRILRSSCVLRAASRGDMSVLRVLVDNDWTVECETQENYNEILGQVMARIYNWDLQEINSLTFYITLLLQGGVLGGAVSSQLKLECGDHRRTEAYTPGSIMWDVLVIICPPLMRKTLQMAYIGSGADPWIAFNRAGVLTAAQDGTPRLSAYLEAHREDDPFLTRVTLEECLLFAAISNDSKTVSGLLEFGVDPRVGLLSKNLEQHQKGSLPLNPTSVATVAGNLEVLSLLLSKTDISYFLDNAPVRELVQHKTLEDIAVCDVTANERCRLFGLLRSYVLAQMRSSKLAAGGTTDGEGPSNSLSDNGVSIEVLEYIRTVAHSWGHGQKVDMDIVKCAVRRHRRPWLPRSKQHLPCDVLLIKGLIDAHLNYEEKGMDLLHLSIRNHCSFTVVRFLSDKGLKVHSNPNGNNGNSMLHDALLSYSPDRSAIVYFLLKEGADCEVGGDGLSILEASLWNSQTSLEEFSDCHRMFERLLDAGATAYQWPRKRLSKWRSLIQMLLDIQASDNLILRVVGAGAPLNAYGYGPRGLPWNLTPLQAAVWHKRESLARELIRRGADAHAPASQQCGLTSLQAACLQDLSVGFLEHLVLVLGVEVNEHPAELSGVTSLAAAAAFGSLNTVEFLLDHGADINATCRDSGIFPDDRNKLCRPLDMAVYGGSLDKVEFLLKAGGRSRKSGLGGSLEIAARRGHYAILSVLRRWNEKHGRRILEEEALWQRQNPEQALMLSELTDGRYDPKIDGSEDDNDSEVDLGIRGK